MLLELLVPVVEGAFRVAGTGLVLLGDRASYPGLQFVNGGVLGIEPLLLLEVYVPGDLEGS